MLHQLFQCYIALHTTVALCSHQMCFTRCKMLIAAPGCSICLSDLASRHLLVQTSKFASLKRCGYKGISGFPTGHCGA